MRTLRFDKNTGKVSAAPKHDSAGDESVRNKVSFLRDGHNVLACTRVNNQVGGRMAENPYVPVASTITSSMRPTLTKRGNSVCSHGYMKDEQTSSTDPPWSGVG